MMQEVGELTIYSLRTNDYSRVEIEELTQKCLAVGEYKLNDSQLKTYTPDNQEAISKLTFKYDIYMFIEDLVNDSFDYKE